MHGRRLTALLTATAAVLALAVCTQTASAASYDLAGAYTPATVLCDTFTCSTTFQGTATCQSRCAGQPATGDFTLVLAAASDSHPQSDCVPHKVEGTLSFLATDSSLPPNPIRVATVTGNSISTKGFQIRGSFVSDLTQVHAKVFLPPNPVMPGCAAGPFTGTIELPPNPVIPPNPV